MRKSERMAVDETTRLRPNEWSSLEVRIVDDATPQVGHYYAASFWGHRPPGAGSKPK